MVRVSGRGPEQHSCAPPKLHRDNTPVLHQRVPPGLYHTRRAAAGREVIDNKHSTAFEYPPHSLRVCMSIHPKGK